MPKRKAQTAVPAVPKASLGTRIKKDIIKNYQLYLLMIPGFLLLILFKIGPVGAMVIAFEDFSAAKGVFGSTWVGLENFKRILQDPYIWKITKNTIVLAFLSVVVVFPIPIIFSLFLNEVRTKWVRNTVQSLSFLPYFISAAVMVSIMYTLLSPTSGLINILITKLGGTSTNFMAKPEWFRPLYVILEIWQTFGYSAIIYIAAMMNIDPTLYEAAEMDGASRWTKMWRITLPCISTSVITMLIISVGNIFSVNLDRILLMYNTGTYVTADVIQTYAQCSYSKRALAFTGYFLGFKFVEDYIFESTLNSENVVSTINTYVQNEITKPREKSYDPIQKTTQFWLMTDSAVEDLYNQLYECIGTHDYTLVELFKLLSFAYKLSEIGFAVDIDQFFQKVYNAVNNMEPLSKEDLRYLELSMFDGSFLSSDSPNYPIFRQQCDELTV